MTTVDLDPVDLDLDDDDDDDDLDDDVYDVSGIIAAFGTRDTAERLGVSVRTVQRWVKNGVDVYTADKIACKIAGDHPRFVWGRAWC